MSSLKKNTYSFLFLILLCAGAIYVLLCVPLPRQFGLIIRNDLFILPFVILIAFSACVIEQHVIQTLLRGILFALIIAPLSGLWNSGVSEQYFLGGILPWSDAFTLQLNTQRFLYGSLMGQSTALRPISSVFYAAFLFVSQNNYLLLHIFIAVVIAICILANTDVVNKMFGSVCAAFFYACMFFYIRQRLGTFMTEPYGFICGLLCCYFFLTGINKNKQLPILLSFFFLSLSLNARPGPMFLLPAAGLWFFFIYLKESRHRLLLSAIALGLLLSGFAINSYTQRNAYGTSNIPNRQLAEIVYGLCQGGKGWDSAVNTPEMIALDNSDNALLDTLDLCIPLIKKNPENIFLALKAVYYDCLITSNDSGSFSFFNGGSKWMVDLVRYSLMIFWCLGIVVLFKRKNTPVYTYLIFCVVGLLLTQIIVAPFTTYRLRYHATSIWIPAIITGLCLQFLVESILPFLKKRQPEIFETQNLIFSSALGSIIFLTAVFAPTYIHSHPLRSPQTVENRCAAGEETLVTSIDNGSYIYLNSEDQLPAEHVPYFRLPFVRQHIHDTASVEMFEFTDAIDTPTAIIRNIDLQTYQDVLVFSPLELVEGKKGKVQFCGKFVDPPILRRDRFFIPTSAYYFKD